MTPTIDLVRELFQLEQDAISARMWDAQARRPIGHTAAARYREVHLELQRRAKGDVPRMEVHDIVPLIRQFLAAELMAPPSSALMVRVLGEVIANKPDVQELFILALNQVARELLGTK